MPNHYETPERPPAGEVKVSLHPAEMKLIEFVRKIRWGELDQIKIQNGIPVMVKVAFKTVKLY